MDEITTPALVLDLGVVRGNVATMAERIASLPADLRPHIKAHKCAEVARMQVEAGAIGVTAATVREATAMIEAGIGDVFVANEVVSPPSMVELLAAAERARVCVAVDDLDNLASWGELARGRRLEIGVLVEVDVGLGRGGARSDDAVVELARRAASTAGVRFEGLYGYEGHCASEPDPAIRTSGVNASMERLSAAVGACRGAGLTVDVVSAGATGTFEITGAWPVVTEVQAGSYVLMDGFHAPVVEGFGFALEVVTTVLSRHGGLLVVDAGRKSIDVGLRPIAPPPGAEVAFVNEEHVGLWFAGGAPYSIGDRLRLVPGYAPTTVNLFGSYIVVDADRIVDVWSVLARHGTP